MKYQLPRMALAVPLLLLLCAWPRTSVAQAAPAYAVAAWGSNREGQTDVPVAAQSGVTAIAAGTRHTVALIGGVELLPSLKAWPNGNELILSWPTNAVGFKLQSTLDLKSPVTWIDSTSVPAVIGAHFTLTNTTSGGARFYRLRKM